MRIIAGEFSGRVLLAPPTEATRPITDRAKQSLFDALGDRVDQASVLDAFAGTGSMGLECLSRGAKRVVFVERGPAKERLRRNIQALGVESQSVVLPIDAYRIASHPSLLAPESPTIDLAFIDPPYSHTEPGPMRQRLASMLQLLATAAMGPHSLLILRHPREVEVESLAVAALSIYRTQNFGSMQITWMIAPVAEPAEPGQIPTS